MAYKDMPVIVCDTCGGISECHPDDGPPTGWYLLARMKEPGCWEEEWHFCSTLCVDKGTD